MPRHLDLALLKVPNAGAPRAGAERAQRIAGERLADAAGVHEG